jgi:HTH-type transcriptional regulator/antitoxin HigA
VRIPSIRSEADYDAAVKRITRLMGAEPRTPASEELDLLATAVDAYEAEHYPIDPPDPKALRQFELEQQWNPK